MGYVVYGSTIENRINELEKQTNDTIKYITELNELLIKKNIVTEKKIKEILSEIYKEGEI